jgi:hypothetical protein
VQEFASRDKHSRRLPSRRWNGRNPGSDQHCPAAGFHRQLDFLREWQSVISSLTLPHTLT